MTIQFNGLEIIRPESIKEILGCVGLTDHQREARKAGITGSNAAKIMRGDWHDLWLEKCGFKNEADLSDVFYVQLGVWSELLNKAWYSKMTGRDVMTVSTTLAHPEFPFIRGNIDGLTVDNANNKAIFEAKHVNAFTKSLEDVAANYYPQAQHYLAITGLETVVFSVIRGTSEPEVFEVRRDDEYIEKLIERECLFWKHVINQDPPALIDAIDTPTISLDEMRTVDMTGNNSWANNAATFLETYDKVKANESASKALKEMVEKDVKLASGHGVEISRAKNGNLTLRKSK